MSSHSIASTSITRNAFQRRKKINGGIVKKSIWILLLIASITLVQAANPVAPASPTPVPGTNNGQNQQVQQGQQGQQQGQQGQQQGQQGQQQGQQGQQNPPNTSANSSLTSIPQSAAAGGITITQPQQTAAQSYYKIAEGVSVTFGWNFTSVLVYPTSLIVQAYCSENQNTYTIATSLPGTATALTWAPYDYDQSAIQLGQPQLIQATYRLQIFDQRGLNVAAQSGLFQPNTKVEFALYQPKPYTPISQGWICAGCNNSSKNSLKSIPKISFVLLISFFVTYLTML